MYFADFYKNKRIFITGMTGFKGTWLYLMLSKLGATVKGYSLAPENDSLMKLLEPVLPAEIPVINYCADIRDYPTLLSAMQEFKPDIVMHLAA